MKLMRNGVQIDPETMDRGELEKLGAWLRRLADAGTHQCVDRDACTPFAGTACGEVGRELHRVREIWRDKNRRGWRERTPEDSAPPRVQAGHYAIRDENGEWSFFKIDTPESGRWAGYVFVTRFVGDRKVRISRAMQAKVLREIGKDPIKALRDYGHQIGSCGVCNRTLTDPDSIAAGIGPVCEAKVRQ